MAFSIEAVREAYERIAPHIRKTPLLRLADLDRHLGCEVYIKAECMQTSGSFKYRGVMNRLLSLTEEELRRGIVAASSGNHGGAIAYACAMRGVKAAIVLPETAAAVKKEKIKALGAEVIECDAPERFAVAEKLCRERGAVMVPPFNDEAVMAGQGTAGLEIMAQCPDVDAVVVPVSGGGLISGVATAVKAVAPHVRVYGAEPAVLPRYTESLKAGRPVMVEKKDTIADALVSQIPGDKCFPHAAANTDTFADVSEEYILKGMLLLLLEGKVLCEPSSGIGIGAVLQGLLPVKRTDKVCFLISGGSVSAGQLEKYLAAYGG